MTNIGPFSPCASQENIKKQLITVCDGLYKTGTSIVFATLTQKQLNFHDVLLEQGFKIVAQSNNHRYPPGRRNNVYMYVKVLHELDSEVGPDLINQVNNV